MMSNRVEVLDKGYVELVDSMGDDCRIVEAARTCIGKENTVTNIKDYISMLWKSGHTSPFEQVVFTFRVKCPIFVARQWLRHRTARVNELSMRHTNDNLEFYIPPAERLGDDSEMAKLNIKNAIVHAENIYRCLLLKKVPAEVARIVLPVNVYTTFMWQMDLHNLLHFLKLRTALGAQWEIRQYATAIQDLIKQVVPLCVEVVFND